MALDLNYLVNILDKDLLAYQQLLVVTKQEQAAIIHNKPKTIDICIDKKNQLLLAIEKIEMAKQKLLLHITQEFGLAKQLTNFNDVAELLGDFYKDRISTYLLNLKTTLIELKAINQNNGKLLSYSLHFINYMVSNFTNNYDSKCTYTAAGSYQKPSRLNKFEYCF